jgi:multisubunit Na+/H+ antiporter MnhE subunit
MMPRFMLLTLTLTAIYLLVLTSVQPGDVLVGVALSVAIAAASMRTLPGGRAGAPLAVRLAAAPALAIGTLADIVRGTWHVSLYIVRRGRLERPGIVTVPKGARTPSGVAAWGFLTALSPDEIVVDIDDERGVMLVHVLDASDTEAVRRRHHDTYEQRQRRVFP